MDKVRHVIEENRKRKFRENRVEIIIRKGADVFVIPTLEVLEEYGK